MEMLANTVIQKKGCYYHQQISFNHVVLPARPGQPACGNFKAYGFCKYGASCKFDHPVPVNPYQYAGLTMPSLPTAYAPPVSVSICVRITSPPSRSDSTTVSNGDKSAAENQTSENEKQDDGPDKTEDVEDISVDLKLDTLCLSLFYCQQDLSVYFISINGASSDTDDSASVVLRDNQHVVTSRPMDSASMEQAASLITQCQ
ncbi:hypothetical protein F2Q68_00003096 [Brassica cretica]|uniref:C3H1-type domain-containing protein n=1 Tax=Brassica cretica TaxID=69181 RepID=A0A8S9JKU6_BRACR|nr:hypothetical protein F2Q68_00003096 [Brassica cretica]